MRILITGGGSGGHIFPLIAVADALRARTKALSTQLDIRYFGDPGDYRYFLEGKAIRISHIASSKWRRYFSIKNIFEPFKLLIGIVQSLWKVFWFMPDVVFSKGGPGALAILYACRWYRIPVVVHESDAAPGLTNAISARFARSIALSFKEALPPFQFAKGEKKVTGNPVRSELIKGGIIQERAKTDLGFDPARPLLLVLGGSQGAMILNKFILEHSRVLLESIQVLHQTGAEHFEAHKKEWEEMSRGYGEAIKKNYRIVPFLLENMSGALTAADIILSRAGANAIFEIAAMGKPSILVPISDSPNNHQRENAYAYEKAGACTVIEEENLLIGLFANALNHILTNAEARTKMSLAAKQFYIPNAAEIIADEVIRIGIGK